MGMSKKALSLTRAEIPHGYLFFQREPINIFKRTGLSEMIGPLRDSQGLSLRDKASSRETRPLTGRPASHKKATTFQEGRASHREARPLTGRQGISQGGQASYG